MKAKKKLSIVTLGAALTLMGIVGTAPAQAASMNFGFEFTAQETGEEVSGNFVFDDSTPSVEIPDGSLYPNASSEYTITVGEDVYEGSSNSIVVANNLETPDGLIVDSIGFDDFNDFVPGEPPVFLGSFSYTPDALDSQDLPSAVPPSAVFASITTPEGTTLSASNASTSIKDVPEPASTLGVLIGGAFGTGLLLKRKRQLDC